MDKPNYVIDTENRLAEVLGDPAADQEDIEQAQQDVRAAYDDWDSDIAQTDTDECATIAPQEDPR